MFGWLACIPQRKEEEKKKKKYIYKNIRSGELSTISLIIISIVLKNKEKKKGIHFSTLHR